MKWLNKFGLLVCTVLLICLAGYFLSILPSFSGEQSQATILAALVALLSALSGVLVSNHLSRQMQVSQWKHERVLRNRELLVEACSDLVPSMERYIEQVPLWHDRKQRIDTSFPRHVIEPPDPRLSELERLIDVEKDRMRFAVERIVLVAPEAVYKAAKEFFQHSDKLLAALDNSDAHQYSITQFHLDHAALRSALRASVQAVLHEQRAS